MLACVYALAPEFFGAARPIPKNPALHLVFQCIAVARCLIFALFFFAVYRKGESLNVTGAAKFPAIVAAVGLVAVSLPSFISIGVAVSLGAQDWWRVTPGVVLTLPAPVLLIVFLMLAFSTSLWSPRSPGGNDVLRPASYSAAVASCLGFPATAYHFHASSAWYDSIDLVTVVSLAAFFIVLAQTGESACPTGN